MAKILTVMDNLAIEDTNFINMNYWFTKDITIIKDIPNTIMNINQDSKGIIVIIDTTVTYMGSYKDYSLLIKILNF